MTCIQVKGAFFGLIFYTRVNAVFKNRKTQSTNFILITILKHMKNKVKIHSKHDVLRTYYLNH